MADGRRHRIRNLKGIATLKGSNCVRNRSTPGGDDRFLLLHISPGLAVLIVESYLRNLCEVQFVPRNTSPLAVDNLQIPQLVLFAIVKGNFDALAIRQAVSAEYVVFPIIGAVGRDIEFVNLDYGLVVHN